MNDAFDRVKRMAKGFGYMGFAGIFMFGSLLAFAEGMTTIGGGRVVIGAPEKDSKKNADA